MNDCFRPLPSFSSFSSRLNPLKFSSSETRNLISPSTVIHTTDAHHRVSPPIATLPTPPQEQTTVVHAPVRSNVDVEVIDLCDDAYENTVPRPGPGPATKPTISSSIFDHPFKSVNEVVKYLKRPSPKRNRVRLFNPYPSFPFVLTPEHLNRFIVSDRLIELGADVVDGYDTLSNEDRRIYNRDQEIVRERYPILCDLLSRSSSSNPVEQPQCGQPDRPEIGSNCPTVGEVLNKVYTENRKKVNYIKVSPPRQNPQMHSVQRRHNTVQGAAPRCYKVVVKREVTVSTEVTVANESFVSREVTISDSHPEARKRPRDVAFADQPIENVSDYVLHDQFDNTRQDNGPHPILPIPDHEYAMRTERIEDMDMYRSNSYCTGTIDQRKVALDEQGFRQNMINIDGVLLPIHLKTVMSFVQCGQITFDGAQPFEGTIEELRDKFVRIIVHYSQRYSPMEIVDGIIRILVEKAPMVEASVTVSAKILSSFIKLLRIFVDFDRISIFDDQGYLHKIKFKKLPVKSHIPKATNPPMVPPPLPTHEWKSHEPISNHYGTKIIEGVELPFHSKDLNSLMKSGDLNGGNAVPFEGTVEELRDKFVKILQSYPRKCSTQDVVDIIMRVVFDNNFRIKTCTTVKPWSVKYCIKLIRLVIDFNRIIIIDENGVGRKLDAFNRSRRLLFGIDKAPQAMSSASPSEIEYGTESSSSPFSYDEPCLSQPYQEQTILTHL